MHSDSLVPRPSSPSSNIWEAEKNERGVAKREVGEEGDGTGTRLHSDGYRGGENQFDSLPLPPPPPNIKSGQGQV